MYHENNFHEDKIKLQQVSWRKIFTYNKFLEEKNRHTLASFESCENVNWFKTMCIFNFLFQRE